MVKCVFDSFDEAFASWSSNYIVENGFQAFQRLPHTRKALSIKMIKDGYLYADRC